MLKRQQQFDSGDRRLGLPIRRRKTGMTLVEVLVVVVIIAILMSLLIPAISAMRAAARRAQCQANLRNIGQALVNFESANGALPAGRDQKYWAEHSWATRVLPFLEEQAVYDDYDWRKPWWNMGEKGNWADPWELEYVNGKRDDIEGNLALATTDIPVYQCPATRHYFKGAIDYGGNYGPDLPDMEPGFGRGQSLESGMLVAANLQQATRSRRHGVRLNEVDDGLSHTFLVLEDAGRQPHEGGMWANGHNCFSPETSVINADRSNEIYSDHGQIAFALLGDGSVMTLTEETEFSVISALSTRSGHDAHYIE